MIKIQEMVKGDVRVYSTSIAVKNATLKNTLAVFKLQIISDAIEKDQGSIELAYQIIQEFTNVHPWRLDFLKSSNRYVDNIKFKKLCDATIERLNELLK